jgi:hypothetical protein
MVYVSFRRYDDLSNNARLLWECVDSHPVDRLVIDMRHNSGGNYAQGASIWRTRRSRVGP